MNSRQSHSPQTYRNSDPDDTGGGFVETPDPADTAPPAAEATPPAQTADTGPKDMLEAMFGQSAKTAPTEAEAAEAAATGKTVQQLRDEKGRFATGKTEVQPELKKPEVKDGLQMPEGLTAKAQERFQVLANTNKELTARVQEQEPIVQSALSLQQTFHSNGVKREQFEQAMEVVGLMNKGDLEGALRALDEQRKLISLHLGRPIPGADALADHPDLRGEVENLQITEQRALEIARSRTIENRNQQQNQNFQREQRDQQTAVEDHKAGTIAVDKVCRQLQATDLDFKAIEPLLLAEVKNGLLEGIPPQQWPRLIQKTYNVIKQTAGSTRTSGATAGVLRPTGAGQGVKQQPANAYEAMWGQAKPAGM